jgi:hypothetical protein
VWLPAWLPAGADTDSSPRPDDLRMTSVFLYVARRFKARICFGSASALLAIIGC